RDRLGGIGARDRKQDNDRRRSRPPETEAGAVPSTTDLARPEINARWAGDKGEVRSDGRAPDVASRRRKDEAASEHDRCQPPSVPRTDHWLNPLVSPDASRSARPPFNCPERQLQRC